MIRFYDQVEIKITTSGKKRSRSTGPDFFQILPLKTINSRTIKHWMIKVKTRELLLSQPNSTSKFKITSSGIKRSRSTGPDFVQMLLWPVKKLYTTFFRRNFKVYLTKWFLFFWAQNSKIIRRNDQLDHKTTF